jgi:CheY-like chemotaxis protein
LDLNIVVGDMERMLRRLIGADVELIVDLDAGLGLVRADPGQVEQVIMNLVVNARDAMPEGGRLLIRTHNVEFDEEFVGAHAGAEAGTYVALTVRDTGLGMEEDTLERAFEPFFTTKGPGEGTGLGLSMVYGIVKQSGGHVSLSSERGRGTDCTVYLPRCERADEPNVDGTAGPCALKGSETVLLVEDEPQVRVLTERVLGSQGYRVLCAGDPEMALDIASKHDGPVDVLVAGLVLPRMSGRELAETMRRARPEMRVLFVSGYTHETLFERGTIEEQAGFLEKPFSVESLLRKLREVLDSPSVGASRA